MPDRVMLITGASRGIGAATARLAAARGYAVVVNYVARKDAAEAVAADVRKAGRKALTIQADIGKPHEIARLFQAIDSEFGRLDAFFNNAGILSRAAKFVDIAPTRLQQILAAKLGGAAESTDYAFSKGAIDTLTVGLAKELASEGIRVNAVRPGLIETDIQKDFGIGDRVGKYKDLVPMKRGGTPQEVAEAVLWLCSDQASYITGVLLDVSGGRGL
jgi:NAD(P)-dependent dehydrogenase (short-subunit alcohol dehydrogenase family)